jgi:hypothetical protein
MKRLLHIALAAIALAAATGCPNPTNFEGSAKFPGGPSGCYAACHAQNLEMTAFVLSGEFATSCVCRPAAAPGVASLDRGAQAEADAADVSAIAGQIMQTRAAAAQQQNSGPPPGVGH